MITLYRECNDDCETMGHISLCSDCWGEYSEKHYLDSWEEDQEICDVCGRNKATDDHITAAAGTDDARLMATTLTRQEWSDRARVINKQFAAATEIDQHEAYNNAMKYYADCSPTPQLNEYTLHLYASNLENIVNGGE
jgi:RNA polymerase subunit RPABC4/transcription elongation factor Spt4